jgi:uncharacterized RDD family membrane protein YckC
MSSVGLLGFVVLPAITMTLVYQPILERLSMALVSTYAKADITKRISAAIVDALLIATLLILFRSSESLVYLIAGGAYLLLRDAVAGRSVGKFFCSLVVINLETGRPCGHVASVRRNALFLLPGANVAAAFFEARTIVRDPQGQRLGDRLALTQVVEGFGARDVVSSAQEWWLDFLAQLDGNPRRRRRVPAKQVIES